MTMSEEINKVEEGVNNPLKTPEFTGTDEEVVGALSYWNTLVTHVRQLNTSLTTHENKLAVIAHLEHEIALLKADFENVSAVPVPGEQPGTTQMRQPGVEPDPAQQAAIAAGTEVPVQDKIVSPAAAAGGEPAPSEVSPPFSADQHVDHMRRMAGISKPVNRLAQAFKSYVSEPTVAECGDVKPAEKPYDVTRLARIARVPQAPKKEPKIIDGVDVTRMAKIARAPKGS